MGLWNVECLSDAIEKEGNQTTVAASQQLNGWNCHDFTHMIDINQAKETNRSLPNPSQTPSRSLLQMKTVHLGREHSASQAIWREGAGWTR